MSGRRTRATATALASAALLVMLSVAPSSAAAGDLDPTFGDAGQVTTVFPVGSFARAVAIQPDGAIVAVGAAAGPRERGEFAVARYLPDGSLDTSFGTGGVLTTPIAGGGDEARSVAIQPDGRIVVAGTDSGRRFAIVRYLSDGTLDPSFDGDGIVRTNVSRSDDVAYDVLLQPDGRIVAIGAAGRFPSSFALARYRRDGSLDRSFGGDGIVTTRYHGGAARTAALQPDGRIVVAGYNRFGLAVARYRADGRLDRSFDDDGRIGPVAWGVFALAIALYPGGRILVAGDFDIFHVGLVRLRADGRLDRTFGGDGIVHRRVGPSEQALTGVAVRADGTIVGAGYAGPHEASDGVVFRFVVARFLPDGTFDRSFGGGDGKVATFFADGAAASGMATQPDGRIVVVGGAGSANAGAFALARYLP